jgi:Tol biopolymer transport system component/tRNA A-37 threonylcarbamoyl transferase component Bud32
MTVSAERLTAALADRYRIERELGQGGMATVYLAQDLRHDRKVALKVLKPELAAVLGAERFVVEIKTTAALQHPHILPLFDSGTADGFLYYVMPYIQGETLRNKLDRETQLGIDEAVRITREVADALDYAHRHGVIHRDIKPENILLHDGRPMVADFGIALAVSAAAGGRMTETGLSLGTPHYMSPEQATAEKELTNRSDIYSLGCVLYEMLTGSPPHVGATAQQIVTKIVMDVARPVTELRKSVPPNVAAAASKALEKLPADRFESAKAFADALANPAFTATVSGRPIVRTVGPSFRLTAALGAATVLLALLAGWALLRPIPRTEPEPVQFQLLGGPRLRIQGNWTQPFAVSDDGRTVVFTADTGGTSRLWMRTLDDPKPRMLEDTERGMQPAISPDGQWVAFVVGNQVLRKVPLASGAATTLATVDGVTAAIDWLSDDEIVLERFGSGIHRVSANGGVPKEWIPYDTAGGEVGQRRPFVLREAGTVRVLYASSSRDGTTRLAIFAAEDGRRQRLDLDGIQALGMIDGHLIYARGDGALMAVGFDAPGMRLRGAPRQLRERVSSNATGTQVALSPAGTLVYQVPTDGASRLVQADTTGSTTPVGDQARAFGASRFSPDGRRIAVVIGERGAGTDNIWVVDRGAGQMTRVTQGGNAALVDWTPDGRALVFVRRGSLWMQPIGAGGEPSRLADSSMRIVDASIVPDGRSVVVMGPRSQLLRVALDRPATPDTIVPPYGLGTSLRAAWPRVSPDGRWVAFLHRNEYQVYVRSLVDGGTFQVSDEGGSDPVWGNDATRLYYHSVGEVIEAELRTTPAFEVLRRRRLGALPPGAFVHDVAPDGQLLMLVPIGQGTEVRVAVHWGTSVRRALRAQGLTND